MEINKFAEIIAVLTILEPESKTCQSVVNLAQAGTATEGDTDISVLVDINNNHKKEIEAELMNVSELNLEKKQKLISKFFE